MRTTAPGAKTALVVRLQARPSLDGVLVRRGLPTTPVTEDRRIYVLNALNLRREPLAGDIREETYDLRTLIEVRRRGGTNDDVETAAWTVFDELEAELEEGPPPSTLRDASVTSATEGTAPTEDGWITKIDLRVHCRAVIA